MITESTPNGAQADRIPVFIHAAQLATTAVAGISVLSYAAGLIIVSVHLQRYGLRVFDLIRTEYILVGAMWLFLTGGTGALLAVYADQIQCHWKSQEGCAYRGSFVIASLIGGGLVLLMMRHLFMGADFFSGWDSSWNALLVIVMGSFVIRSELTKVYSSLLRSPEHQIWTAAGAFDVVKLLLAAAAMMYFYSLWVYPALSPSFGGGRPQQVRVVPAPAVVESMRALGLCEEMTGPTCGPLQLILETQQAYFLAVPEGRVPAGNGKSARTLRLPKSDMLVRFE